MSVLDDRTRLQLMLDASKKAIAFAENLTSRDLEEDEILRLALVKTIKIVGEAASRVSRLYQDEHPQIPWAKMVAMRNRLIHAFSISIWVFSGKRSKQIYPNW
jgi:uncharacterized protein with HEPN domain